LTYIVVRSGWSNPVWYFSATTRILYSRCPAPPARTALSSARVYANAVVLLLLGGLLAVDGE
jgi:hypothetical protein